MAIEAGAPVSAVRVDGSLVYKGAIDAASPPDLTSAKKGDYYKISGAGTLAGVAVQVDDSIIFNQDASSPLTSAMFDVIDSSALGTASAEDVGTAIGDVVQLENVGGSAGLPAVDGSQLQNVTATIADASETVKGAIEIATNVEAAAGSANDKALVPSNISSISIGQLSNVDLTGLVNTDLLGYNSTSGNFEPTSPTGVPDASETVKGIIEIATNVEAGAGSATDKALVPSNVSSLSIGSGQVSGLATVATSGAYADLSGTPTTATETTEGVIEIATNVEAAAGSATDKALVPSNVSSLSIGSGQVTGLATVATSGAYADLSGTPTTATTSAEGLVELADNTEAAAGTATNRALTPSNISSFTIDAGQIDPVSVSAQSTSFTAAAGNYYRMNPSGSLVVTLPTASAAGDGGEIELKLVTAQTVTINVAAASGDLIDGASSYTLDVQWSAIRLKADGSSVWDVL